MICFGVVTALAGKGWSQLLLGQGMGRIREGLMLEHRVGKIKDGSSGGSGKGKRTAGR